MRKHHNAHKRAHNFFNSVRLWSWESSHENYRPISHGMVRRGLVWTALGQSEVNQISKMQTGWILICRAAMRWPDGTIAVESDTAIAPQAKLNELADYYEVLRKSVLESAVTSAVFDLGWVATPKLELQNNDSELTKIELFELGQYSRLRRLHFEGYCRSMEIKEAI